MFGVQDLAAVWEPSRIEARYNGAYLIIDVVVGELWLKYERSDIFLDAGRSITYEELEQSCAAWWRHWRAYWDRKPRI